MPGKTILYVGELGPGTTCRQRMVALQDLGYSIVPIDTMNDAALRNSRKFLSRVRWKLGYPVDYVRANSRILEEMDRRAVDILWLDKAISVHPRTLRAVRDRHPGCTVVGYSPDDMQARHNNSVYFREGLPLYHAYVTTKSFGVRELESMGCSRVLFVGNGFDPHTHRPMEVSSQDRERLGGEVGFIGTWESYRASSLLCLAKNGIRVRIWGSDWRGRCPDHPNLRVEGRAIYGDEYARAISAFDVNLCFLRRVNRDLQTQRSVEIPACGGFMLAEYSEEHTQLFKEGAEVEFFRSDGELLEKTRHYLANPAVRETVARRGLQRAQNSGYSYADRLKDVLSKL